MGRTSYIQREHRHTEDAINLGAIFPTLLLLLYVSSVYRGADKFALRRSLSHIQNNKIAVLTTMYCYKQARSQSTDSCGKFVCYHGVIVGERKIKAWGYHEIIFPTSGDRTSLRRVGRYANSTAI